MPDPLPGTYAGIVLAGGLGRRMGGAEKPLMEIAGVPMLARAIARLGPQVEHMVLSANGAPEHFAAFGLPTVADAVEGFAGPLAGIHAGMQWMAANRPEVRFAISAAADTPFFPEDLAARLAAGCGKYEDTVVVAASAAGPHPVFALWPVRLAGEIEAYLRSGSGGVLAFADLHRRVSVPFEDIVLPDGSRADPFFNVNTPEDATRAAEIAAILDAEAT